MVEPDPGVPIGMRATVVNNKTVTLSWAPRDGQEGFIPTVPPSPLIPTIHPFLPHCPPPPSTVPSTPLINIPLQWTWCLR